MDCERAQELLGERTDDPGLADHLAACADCAGAAAVVRLARDLPEEDPPAGFESRLRARLSSAPPARPRTRIWAAAGLAGVLAAAGLATLMLSRPHPVPAAGVTFSAAAPAAALRRSTLPRAAVVHGSVAAAGAAVPSPAPAQSAAATSAALPGTDLIGGRKVIQQAQVTVRVADVRGVFDNLQSWVSQAGGYVGSSNFNSTPHGDRASLQLRVPAAQIAPLLTKLRSVGQVTSVSQSGRDVTGQYIDLGAQLQALQAEEQAYLRLLSQAKTISDTLQLEQQLTQVRAQIESITQQQRQLQRLTSLATVNLQILATARPSSALRASWMAFLAALRAIGLAAAWALPWAVLVGVAGGAVLGVRALWRR